jgi:hypothetical protein
MIIADAKESKHLYKEVFQEYYDWEEKLRVEGVAESESGPWLMPYHQVTHTID